MQTNSLCLIFRGYMAPEYLSQGRLTEKVDVYSYGVLVLEIISGVENNNYHSEDILSTLVTTVSFSLPSCARVSSFLLQT